MCSNKHMFHICYISKKINNVMYEIHDGPKNHFAENCSNCIKIETKEH